MRTESELKGGYEFFYKGWKSTRELKWRCDANAKDLFPKQRGSSLDATLLESLGLTQARMYSCDALFFLQLLLPICNPSKSGVDDDPRSGFYTDVTQFSNLYKHQVGIGNGYGHDVDEAKTWEFVRFDGVLVRDGVRGGGDGAIYRRWNVMSSTNDKHISSSLSLSRWFNLKRLLKLNNNDLSPKRGEVGYDPAYKYDMIYRTIVDNVIALTRSAEMDLTGDESSWAHQGYGESGSNIIKRIQNKPGVSKGGQTVLVSATNRIRPYWYQHRHNKNTRYPSEGMNAEGPAEVRTFIDEMKKHVRHAMDDESMQKKIIFECEPHSTWDNYFSGE